MIKSFYCLLALSIFACQPEVHQIDAVEPFHPSDPFAKRAPDEQVFTFDLKEAIAIKGQQSTLIYLPECALLDQYGKCVEESITMTLIEARSLSDMVMANLTTTSQGGLLISDGMLFIEFESKGSQLRINPEAAPYVQLPTDQKIPGMQVYDGYRDSLGNMEWTNEKDLEDYLIPVDFDLLDFRPDRWEQRLTKSLPIASHSEISDELSDSLYYAMNEGGWKERLNGLVDIEIRESFHIPRE